MRSQGLSAAASRRLRHPNARATSGTQAIAPDRYQVESALAAGPNQELDKASDEALAALLWAIRNLAHEQVYKLGPWRRLGTTGMYRDL